MNEGKNTWRVGWAENEIWNLRNDVIHHNRLSNAQELFIYKTGRMDYWTVDFLFAIYKPSGECITGDLKYKDHRTKSNALVMGMLHDMTESDYPILTPDMIDRLLYLEKLYALTNGRMLNRQEWEQFKKIYHAIQREEYDLVIAHLEDYNPSKILNRKP